MTNSILSLLNAENGRFAITINSEELLLLIAKIRQIVQEEVNAAYRKKLSEEYMTKEEVLNKFKLSDSVLSKWNTKEFLVPVKIGGKNLYRKSDIDKIIFSPDKRKK